MCASRKIKCERDVKVHLKSLDVRDSTLKTEEQLLLARAGKHKNIEQTIVEIEERKVFSLLITRVNNCNYVCETMRVCIIIILPESTLYAMIFYLYSGTLFEIPSV